MKFDPSSNMNSVYSAYWDQINAGLSDHWFYGNSDNMNVVSSMYDDVIEYLSKDSEYIEAMMGGCFDTNAEDWFSNEFLKNKDENGRSGKIRTCDILLPKQAHVKSMNTHASTFLLENENPESMTTH